jgi:hypothetical protein
VEILSYIILILLSLVGYSGGVAGRVGKKIDPKPVVLDLILVAIIWTGAIYSRAVYGFNKWLLILVWVVIAASVGALAVSLRRLPGQDRTQKKGAEELSPGIFRRLWHRWMGFSKRMGSFQSRVMLSFFFFLFISPVALLIKLLGDPLRIKKTKTSESFWLAKGESSTQIEDYRRQF